MIGFHPEALEEIEGARDWYEEKRPGLGQDLVDEIERVLARLADAPLSFARAPESRAARRAQLSRFPYWLIFAPLDDGDVLIVALAHARRRAGYWRGRATAKR